MEIRLVSCSLLKSRKTKKSCNSSHILLKSHCKPADIQCICCVCILLLCCVLCKPNLMPWLLQKLKVLDLKECMNHPARTGSVLKALYHWLGFQSTQKAGNRFRMGSLSFCYAGVQTCHGSCCLPCSSKTKKEVENASLHHDGTVYK